MHMYRLLMTLYVCRDNPAVASCSIASMLSLDQRLAVPGQSKWLVWLSGDFSMKAQSYGIEPGIELWHPVLGHQKFYCAIMHPQAAIDASRRALAGKLIKGTAIVSTVCERLNKLMCEFHFRKLIAGRPRLHSFRGQSRKCSLRQFRLCFSRADASNAAVIKPSAGNRRSSNGESLLYRRKFDWLRVHLT